MRSGFTTPQLLEAVYKYIHDRGDTRKAVVLGVAQDDVIATINNTTPTWRLPAQIFIQALNASTSFEELDSSFNMYPPAIHPYSLLAAYPPSPLIEEDMLPTVAPESIPSDATCEVCKSQFAPEHMYRDGNFYRHYDTWCCKCRKCGVYGPQHAFETIWSDNPDASPTHLCRCCSSDTHYKEPICNSGGGYGTWWLHATGRELDTPRCVSCGSVIDSDKMDQNGQYCNHCLTIKHIQLLKPLLKRRI
jgi:hypothetical protein